MTGARGFTVGVLQARTSSSRLPGKVLKPLMGEPMILRQLERIQRAQSLDLIVVATSEDPSDDQLALSVVDAGYDVVRGSLNDVLARFIQVIDEYDPENIVRLTADCPLICASVIDEVVHHFHAGIAEYVSNTMVPSYPDGVDVEVFTAESLKAVQRFSTDTAEREHVTLGIYRRPDEFTIENVVDPTGKDHSMMRWTVDTPEDFDFVQSVYDHLLADNPDFEYTDILTLLSEHPELQRTETSAGRNTALDGLDTGVMQHKSRGGA